MADERRRRQIRKGVNFNLPHLFIEYILADEKASCKFIYRQERLRENNLTNKTIQWVVLTLVIVFDIRGNESLPVRIFAFNLPN